MGADRLIFGVLTIVVGIFGLFYASGSHDGYSYFVGLALFFGAVLFMFALIKGHYDQLEKDGHK
ncbi:uncharacterized membrane protein HdeD (DUF308 family) [Thalassospira sp. MBR-102]|jgi:uncharacterized membrane protein HdeD (DUF308 family)|uniref:Uncharacterized protein n=3 Tax=Thalassospira TaxID=168934 RepID=A0ABR5Y360_9PROT|nr:MULTISPECIES: hypothetical protein [Thalassospira]MBR9780233.1 hypothetical protein [Rhodospirillales bacterium]AJD50488.1 hypothetical protein TH3_01810 [Thalassospira xiamenensis M-5 = DSM 17429]KEO55797.1 hypothetical protein SMB34_05120 [Thalassospira permensis NBRC 106175]KZD04835.1 hypothetical protein AUP40_14865 [Thalassospira xiamenensis]KZD05615.1 hypothetical protein AUP45_20870 [Thalassospira xiamenensis]|tara:strand:- start:916 stop:1107 length:192 start_codon:yes stop_codon:yes gene_type:complete